MLLGGRYLIKMPSHSRGHLPHHYKLSCRNSIDKQRKVEVEQKNHTKT